MNMGTIENALGKQIQITNSQIYCQLSKKYDYQFEMDYESLIMSVSNLAHTMGTYLGADIGKIDLYTKILGLGKIDGGKAVLDYVNLNIPDTNNKISELDIMLYNLHKIFPDLEERFNVETLREISELNSGNAIALEIKIIRLSYYLKLVAQYLKKSGKLDDKKAIDFVFNEMYSIINKYRDNNQLIVNENINSLILESNNQSIQLNSVDARNLDKIIELYRSGNITKNDLISELNSYEVIKEKKNKVR